MQPIYEHYRDHGFAIANGLFQPQEVSAILGDLDEKNVFDYRFSDDNSHNLFVSVPAVHQLAYSGKLLPIARHILGDTAMPFYAIILDKTRDNNWGLDWHQDLKIAVKQRIDTPGYTHWSEESGIPHVEPPASVLQQLLTIRLHLDDCDETNGAVWAIPGSHKGIIPAGEIAATVRQGKIYPCTAAAGSIMLMSPLLLHKSPYSLSGKKRRVLQIEYRAAELAGGLQWHNGN